MPDSKDEFDFPNFGTDTSDPRPPNAPLSGGLDAALRPYAHESVDEYAPIVPPVEPWMDSPEELEPNYYSRGVLFFGMGCAFVAGVLVDYLARSAW